MALLGKLTVREQPIGGEVAPVVLPTGAPVNGRREITLLIHGYNNSQVEADGYFASFSDHLAQISSSTSASIFGFYWPGDTHLKVISALSYPVELGPAKDSAQRLFDFLQGLSGPGGTPIMVRLVAHSLGCRLALELLRRFAVSLKATQVVFASVSLMAAAVPVGRHGHPEVWSIPGARMNYAHGDYWPGKESSAAVVAFMGGPVHLLPGVNSIPVNQTLTSEDIPGRNLPPAGSIIETGIFG
jgi:pimeloyl-ACP methyl ester carboxylesterase